MSQLAVINYAQLEEFLQQDGPTDEDVKTWYDKLAEYEIEGNETPTEIELLYNGARYLMGFGFTAAEELRDVAEQEAVMMAEKEDQWEEQKVQLKEEIEGLRERITSKAEIGDSTEAFRAQIDSLREENRQLMQANRDRDREMADQRDRFENLASRVEHISRERDALSEHKIQLEDTIRELNRRISSKTEDTTTDWESKKLKLRNEQVLTISRQMQAVVVQNDELREEIERVSDALEEATRIIEQSAFRYTELTNQLEESQIKVEELINQNKILTDGLPADLVDKLPKCMDAAQQMISGMPKDKIKFLYQLADLILPKFLNENDEKEIENETGYTRMVEIEDELRINKERNDILEKELNSIMIENERLKQMITTDKTGDKERELDQLKDQLIKATKDARKLFGESLTETPGQDPTTTLRMRILQLEHTIEQLNEQLDAKQAIIEEVNYSIEKKDENNMEILTELNQLKDTRYGSSRDEINRLNSQMKYRDEQISKLQQHCTLLQVELGRYSDGTHTDTVSTVKKPRITTNRTNGSIRKTGKEEKEEKEEVVDQTVDIPEKIISVEKPISSRSAIKVVEKGGDKKEYDYSELAQQAILISNLYQEMMHLMEELEYKDELLRKMDTTVRQTDKSYQEMKAQLEMAYDEVKKLKKENIDIEEKIVNETKEMEMMEMERLVESINIGGNEMERRMGETTRKLVTERMERIRYHRQCIILKNKVTRLEGYGKRLKETMRRKETESDRKMIRMKYEIDMATIEIGKLQNKVLKSVDIDEYDKVMRKYKKLVKETTGVVANNEETARQDMEVYTQSTVEAEFEAKENMLKKMIDVVSGHSEFWSKEAAMLQSENEELIRFIEDFENESDLKKVLGSVERRLLDTIRELRENEREYMNEKRKQRGNDAENVRDSERLRHERYALLNVLNILQRENKMLRDQSIGSVSLQQLETFGIKILEMRQYETETIKQKQEMNEMMIDIQNERKNMDRTMSNDNNNELSDIQLQMAITNASKQSAKAKQYEKMVHLKERRMEELNGEIKELKDWNLELIQTVERFKDYMAIREVAREEKQEKNNGTVQRENGDTMKIKSYDNDKESDYEMDIKSESSSDRSTSDRIVVRTIVQDNVEVFEHRIKEITSSAQVAVQGYKEQLQLKDNAIARYKQMLQEKINEGVQVIEKVEIIEKEVEIPKKETEEQLIRTEEKLRKLENEMRKMKENEKKEMKGIEDGEEKEYVESGIQTEEVEEIRKEKEEEDGDVSSQKPIYSAKSDKVRRLEDEMKVLQEMMTKTDTKDNENVRQKYEIKDLKTRIERLTRTNKELMATCEQIKEDALAELSTFRRNNETSDERRITDIRVELDRLKNTNRILRQTNEELHSEILKLNTIIEVSNKKTKNDPDEWDKKKKQEEMMSILKDKLKKKDAFEKELIEKLAKREKVIETMRNDQALRTGEIERLTRRLKANDPTVIRNQLNTSWQQKVTLLEGMVTKNKEEFRVIRKKLILENDMIKKQKDGEIEELRKANNEIMKKIQEKEVIKKPRMVSIGTETDEIIERKGARIEDITAEKKKNRLTKSRTSEALWEKEYGTISSISSISGRSLKKQQSSDGSSSIETIIMEDKRKNSEEKKNERKIIDKTIRVSEHMEDEKLTDYMEMKKMLRFTEIRLMESQDKLIQMERDYSQLHDKFDRLQMRSNREEKPTGAVLVLSDKLAAKDREIAQLKNHISHMQRTVILPLEF